MLMHYLLLMTVKLPSSYTVLYFCISLP